MLVDQHIVNINKQLPWPSQGVVVVAVSGGPDSVCTLRVCHELAQIRGFSIHVAHLDHGLRGEESHRDAIFTKELAASLGWPITCAYRDVQQLHGYTGSLQQRCRAARQDFLDQVIEDQRAVAIVYGHNLDDQAETVLQHLVRGSGLQGLTGMRQSEEKEGVLVL
ncbi:MAG: tRNA lysidine(34) synthetase TilS, partial [Desulfuromusa sp.]|nr:tRNA lysidine(34) synthetase TilS [Desulfuromusa sp.]